MNNQKPNRNSNKKLERYEKGEEQRKKWFGEVEDERDYWIQNPLKLLVKKIGEHLGFFHTFRLYIDVWFSKVERDTISYADTLLKYIFN